MIATAKRKALGEILLDRGWIKPDQLECALLTQHRSNHAKLLGEILIDQGICNDEQIIEAVAAINDVPFVRIKSHVCDAAVLGMLSCDFLEKHQVIPLHFNKGILTVAVSEPTNVFLFEELERVSGHQVQLVAATAKDIRATLQAYLPESKISVIDGIVEKESPEANNTESAKIEDIANLHVAASDSPVVKLVNQCIFSAAREGATDIHIEPGEKTLRVRFRIDGRLIERLNPPFQMHRAITSHIKSMAGLDITERHLPQQGIIRVMMDKRPADLRISTMPGKHGEKVVIRLIDNDGVALNLEKLGLSDDMLKRWRKCISLPTGILLVTGPAESGKSTTLYASLSELNTQDNNVCTVEDPIDRTLDGVNQFQVNEKAGFTFAKALRSLLGHDPDVIMVGEIRDGETARLATQAALAGHLVLSTLQTHDAATAITRLLSLGIEPYLVGATVSGILAQRLVRKLCQDCKESDKPTVHECRLLEKTTGSFEKVFRAKGCPKCRGLGYRGRMGIYELLVPSDATIDHINAGASLATLRNLAVADGMVLLQSDGLNKVKSGLTTVDEVLRVTA